MEKLKPLLSITIILTLIVIALGAYTRLSDAGLGCPDWPGCYGHPAVPSSQMDIEVANYLYADRPVEQGKAWLEMIHRYFAGGLGILLLYVSYLLWQSKQFGSLLPAALSTIVIVQGLLGMWTVTMMLMPIIVVLHLLGGFLLFTIQLVLYSITSDIQIQEKLENRRRLLGVGVIALLCVLIQIVLGGWTSTNYAALVCTALPFCQAGWLSQLDWHGAFVFWESQAGFENFEFGVLEYEARMTIHVIHRIGAIVATIAVLAFAAQLWRTKIQKGKRFAVLLTLLLLLQVGLGVSNIIFSLPISLAVMHNLGGALLLASLSCICFVVSRNHLDRQ